MKQQRYLSVLTAALLALGSVSAYAAAGGNGGGNGGGHGAGGSGGNAGGMSGGHMSGQALSNSNGMHAGTATRACRAQPTARIRSPIAPACSRVMVTRTGMRMAIPRMRRRPRIVRITTHSAARCKRGTRMREKGASVPFFIEAPHRRRRAETSCRPDLQPAVTASYSRRNTDRLHADDGRETVA